MLRYSLDGAPMPALNLPTAATSRPAAHGNRIAVGAGRSLVLIADGKPAWTAPMPATVTAVALTDTLLIAGGEDGVVRAYAP